MVNLEFPRRSVPGGTGRSPRQHNCKDNQAAIPQSFTEPSSRKGERICNGT
jgi:hypothetical protein